MVEAKGYVAAVAATDDAADGAARLVISSGSSPVSQVLDFQRWRPRYAHRKQESFTPQGHSFPHLVRKHLTVLGSVPYVDGWQFVPESGEWYKRALIFRGLDPSEDTPEFEPGSSFDGRYTHAIRVATLHATRSDHFLPACNVHHSHSDRAYVTVPEV